MLRRVITRNGKDVTFTFNDLYNMFGGGAFKGKLVSVRMWICNISGAGSFDIASNVYDAVDETSTVSYADAGNGRNYPAVHIKIPPMVRKEITLSTATTAVATAHCDAASTNVVMEVTMELRI